MVITELGVFELQDGGMVLTEIGMYLEVFIISFLVILKLKKPHSDPDTSLDA